MPDIKKLFKTILPGGLLRGVYRIKRGLVKFMRRGFEFFGLRVVRSKDYYSPLPSEFELSVKRGRWDKPSSLAGVCYDVERYKGLLSRLTGDYGVELGDLGEYGANVEKSFGPGYPELDAAVLYMMIRDLRPRRYLEVGSGLSTYYCSLAARKNGEQGDKVDMTCIEPFPYECLGGIEGIEIVERPVQDVEWERFESLGENDVLFIDSSHVLKIGGDVAYLYLEILPRLKRGVVIHVHDVPFPYNTPYPADKWVLCEGRDCSEWPRFWNEAMVLQALLAFNTSFEIVLSTPLIRYHDEGFLAATFAGYKPVDVEPNTFSSIWLRKTK